MKHIKSKRADGNFSIAIKLLLSIVLASLIFSNIYSMIHETLPNNLEKSFVEQQSS